MLYAQNSGYNAALATASTMVLWASEVNRGTTLEGFILSSQALSAKLQVSRQGSTATAAGAVALTAELADDWITVETLAITAATVAKIPSYNLGGRRMRLIAGNASGSAAAVTYEVNVRE